MWDGPLSILRWLPDQVLTQIENGTDSAARRPNCHRESEREPNAGTSRPGVVTLSRTFLGVVSRAILVSASAALVAGCASIGSPGPSASPGAGPLTEAAAKEALLVRFGPLVYCDPDFYAVARADEATAATEHLAAMHADAAGWAFIAAAKRSTPLRPRAAACSSPRTAIGRCSGHSRSRHRATPGASTRCSGGTGPEASASPSTTHVVGAIAADGTIHIDKQEPSGPPPGPICLARGTRIATPAGRVVVEAFRPVIASGRSTVSDDGSRPPSSRSGRCRCRPATRSFTWSARTGASACDGWSGHQTLVIHPALNAPTHDRLGFWVTRRVFRPHRCEESCANLRRKQVLIGMVRARMVGT